MHRIRGGLPSPPRRPDGVPHDVQLDLDHVDDAVLAHEEVEGEQEVAAAQEPRW